MILAIEYTRASTEHQEYSVGDQSKYNHDWAKRNEYKIIKTYSDDGISGGSVAKRPGFLSMIEDITTGKLPDIKALLIWDSFRFARNMVEFLTYKQMIRQHGIAVIAVSEPMVQDEDAQLYIDAINGASGELYLRKLSKDSKRGIQTKVIDRHEHLGFAPYGYRMNSYTKVLEIFEQEAQWVRYIFQSVLNGVPYLQICASLNEAGVRTRKGYKWYNTQLCYALRNKTYCGLLEVNLDGHHGIYAGKHKPIIDHKTFDRVQTIMDERASKHKPYEHSTNKYVHWLSGLLRCPYCNGAFSHAVGSGGRKPRYRCNNRQNGIGCKNLSIKVETAEKIVLNKLQEIYDYPEIICTLNVTIPQPRSPIDYDAEIKKLHKQLTHAKKAYIEEIDSLEEYRENKIRLTKKKKKIMAKQNNINTVQFDPVLFQEKCLSVMSLLQSDVNMEKKVTVSHNLIEKIVANNVTKEIKIYFYA